MALQVATIQQKALLPALFEEYNADNAETHIGIHVADKNTNKVTTIEGIEKTMIGSLVNFRGSKVKEILFDR